MLVGRDEASTPCRVRRHRDSPGSVRHGRTPDDQRWWATRPSTQVATTWSAKPRSRAAWVGVVGAVERVGCRAARGRPGGRRRPCRAVGRGGERLARGERLLAGATARARRPSGARRPRRPATGRARETGASEPSTTSTPSSSIQRSGKHRSARPGHSRSVTSRSSSRWAGCTLARTPSPAMRRTSSRVVSWTCSMPPRAPVSVEGVERLGRRPGRRSRARRRRARARWPGASRVAQLLGRLVGLAVAGSRGRPSRRRGRSTRRCGC